MLKSNANSTRIGKLFTISNRNRKKSQSFDFYVPQKVFLGDEENAKLSLFIHSSFTLNYFFV